MGHRHTMGLAPSWVSHDDVTLPALCLSGRQS
jgi:hypothetical protein